MLSLIELLRVIYTQRLSFRYLKEFVNCASEAVEESSRSFSQAGEDKMLHELLGEVHFFIDIGANDGITDSNTFYFAIRGASGLCFEPTARMFHRLSALYRFHREVRCFRIGISNEEKSVKIVSAGAVSYIPGTEDKLHSALHSSYLTEHGQPETVSLTTFENAVGPSAPRTIDLLNIDVEGHELNVLMSIPFDRYQFRAIVIETHVRDEWRHRDYDAITNLLSKAGYKQHSQTWVNTIYVPLNPLIIVDKPADLTGSPFTPRLV